MGLGVTVRVSRLSGGTGTRLMSKHTISDTAFSREVRRNDSEGEFFLRKCQSVLVLIIQSRIGATSAG